MLIQKKNWQHKVGISSKFEDRWTWTKVSFQIFFLIGYFFVPVGHKWFVNVHFLWNISSNEAFKILSIKDCSFRKFATLLCGPYQSYVFQVHINTRDEFKLEFPGSSELELWRFRAELGHFNFLAETELTILTICMSKIPIFCL